VPDVSQRSKRRIPGHNAGNQLERSFGRGDWI
jgi:hypothetical protein